jgi:hypothetical protein
MFLPYEPSNNLIIRSETAVAYLKQHGMLVDEHQPVLRRKHIIDIAYLQPAAHIVSADI